jgi:hypothetical protein
MERTCRSSTCCTGKTIVSITQLITSLLAKLGDPLMMDEYDTPGWAVNVSLREVNCLQHLPF